MDRCNLRLLCELARGAVNGRRMLGHVRDFLSTDIDNNFNGFLKTARSLEDAYASAGAEVLIGNSISIGLECNSGRSEKQVRHGGLGG